MGLKPYELSNPVSDHEASEEDTHGKASGPAAQTLAIQNGLHSSCRDPLDAPDYDVVESTGADVEVVRVDGWLRSQRNLNREHSRDHQHDLQ